jgi:hypothetical protein
VPATDTHNIEIFENIPGIKIDIEPYLGDHTIARISFKNIGNKNAPTELLQAIVIPEHISIPQLLKITPNIQVYSVQSDVEIESVGVTIGCYSLDKKSNDVLLALIVLKSLEGHRTLHHCVCELD